MFFFTFAPVTWLSFGPFFYDLKQVCMLPLFRWHQTGFAALEALVLACSRRAKERDLYNMSILASREQEFEARTGAVCTIFCTFSANAFISLFYRSGLRKQCHECEIARDGQCLHVWNATLMHFVVDYGLSGLQCYSMVPRFDGVLLMFPIGAAL